jgi:glyceraldehyde 3-phosphate dehydrogenase
VTAAGSNPPRRRPDVVLYGFGRIGRLLARLMIENAGAGYGLNLRAVVVRRGPGDDLVKRASLLRRDTVYSCQVIRVMEEMANAQRPAFPTQQTQVTAV